MKLNEILNKYGFENEEAFFEKRKDFNAFLAIGEIIKNYKIHEFCTNKVLLKNQKLKSGYLVLVALISDLDYIESYAVGYRHDDVLKVSAYIDSYENGTHFYSLNKALAFFEEEAKNGN